MNPLVINITNHHRS